MYTFQTEKSQNVQEQRYVLSQQIHSYLLVEALYLTSSVKTFKTVFAQKQITFLAKITVFSYLAPIFMSVATTTARFHL